MIEVTLDTPDALAAIRRAASDGLFLGAGTVLSAEQVRSCADAGARFVVSPGTRPDVVRSALDAGLTPIPGAFTPTEILAALSLGVEEVKIFPASLGGPAYITTLRGPFSSTGFVPTGGIGLDEIGAYLRAGADRVGLGGALVGSRPPDSAEDLAELTSRVSRAVENAREARNGSERGT